MDLAGNVWDWALDGYVDPYDMPRADCAELTMTANRVVRGGGFADDESYGRGARRFAGPPTNRGFDVGVRCARATWAR